MSTITVSARGQIVIPAAIRRALGIRPGVRLEVAAEGAELRIKPARKKIGQAEECINLFANHAGSVSAEEISARLAKAMKGRA